MSIKTKIKRLFNTLTLSDLIAAIEEDDLQTIEQYIRNHNMNDKDSELFLSCGGRTLLEVAFDKNSSINTIKLLINLGFNSYVDVTYILSYIIHKDNEEIYKEIESILNQLLFNYFPIRKSLSITSEIKSAFEKLTKKNNIQIIGWLINSVEETSKNDILPPTENKPVDYFLRAAIENNKEKMVEHAISLGANVNRKTYGISHLELAELKENFNIAEILLDHGANPEDNLKKLIIMNNHQAFKKRLSRIKDINKPIYGELPIEMALKSCI